MIWGPNRYFAQYLASAAMVGAALVPVPALAHLLPKQTATMKLVGNSANFVVSVPVSTLVDVDQDGDGQLSPDELAAGQAAIAKQFNARFTVSDDTAGDAKPAMTWVISPETDHSHGSTGDYVIVLHRVFFEKPVAAPTLSTTLFGNDPTEKELSVRATRQVAEVEGAPAIENFVLRPDEHQHTFFDGPEGGHHSRLPG